MLNTFKKDKRKAEEQKLADNVNILELQKQEMMKEIEALKGEIELTKQSEVESEKNKLILADLYDKRIIDADGNLL